MDAFRQTFIYYPEYRVIVCKACKHSVFPSAIVTHLTRKNHKEYPPRVRREIRQHAEGIPNVAKEPKDVVFPQPTDKPIRELVVEKDGFQCMEVVEGEVCGHIQKGIQNIQSHYAKEHGWTNQKRGGRPRKSSITQPRPWRSGFQFQKFMAGPALSRPFEVGREQDQERQIMVEEIVRIDREQEQRIAEEMKAKEQERGVPDTDNQFETDSWLRRTGWAVHLRGIKRVWLREMIQMPVGKEDPSLTRIIWAVGDLVVIAKRVSQSIEIGRPAIELINRREHGGESNEKPFFTGQRIKTMEKYSRIWMELICYVWRCEKLRKQGVPVKHMGGIPEDEQDSSRGEESESESESDDGEGQEMIPGYRMNPIQRACFDQIQIHVDWFLEAEEESENSDDSWDFAPSTQARNRQIERERRRQARAEEKDENVVEKLPQEAQEVLVRELLRFFISLLDHDIGDNEFNSPICSGLAVMGIDEQGGWKGPLRTTQVMSGIVTVSKMLVLLKSAQDREREVERLKRDYSEEKARELASSIFSRVAEQMKKFMTLTTANGKPSPIDAVLRLRAYGRKIRNTTTEVGVIDWDGEKVIYQGIGIEISGLRSMVHGLVQSTAERLYRDLLLIEVDEEGSLTEKGRRDRPEIEWDVLVDHPAETRVGWNLFADERNSRYLGIGEVWLRKRVIQEFSEEWIHTEEVREVISSNQVNRSQVVTKLQWRVERIRQFKQRIERFKEKLLVLVHLCGGQPARGMELVSQLFRNSEAGTPRSVYIERGLLVMVTFYHKGFGFSGNSKVIHRYLPREVGELVFYYLWLVVPFWEHLERVCSGKRDIASGYIWEPLTERKEKEIRREDNRREENQRRVGRRGQQLRDRMVSETRSPSEGRVKDTVTETDPEIGDIFDDNNQVLWDTDRVRKALSRVVEDAIGVKMNIMAWRHIAIAIYRRYIHGKRANRLINEIDDDQAQESDDEDEFFDLQAGHGSMVAQSIYARNLSEADGQVQSRREGFREVSIQWHRFLMFQSVMQTVGAFQSRQGRYSQVAVEEEMRRWNLMREVDIQQQLQGLLGRQERFRGVQEEALKAIMLQKSPIVVVMGTGGGKSMMFMLPASCSTGVTVVVVPLVSLRGDLKRRCEEVGIDCVEWSSRRPNEWASVVLVTPESAVGEAFGGFMARQRWMGRLDRIVIDECHVALDSTNSWRQRILRLQELITWRTQMVYLTATLPPREEGEFIKIMGISRRDGTVDRKLWFRGITTRKNVRYSIKEYNSEDGVPFEQIREGVANLKSKEVCIVYCETIAMVKMVAKELGCPAYHRAAGTEQVKRRIVDGLVSGYTRVIAATNALGLGVDAPRIRLVMHVGRVRKLRDYAQESGRAGRDGRPSEAVIFDEVRYNKQGQKVETVGRWIDEDMRLFVRGTGCRRVVIDRAMDGRVDRIGCEGGERACDICEVGEERIEEERIEEMFEEERRVVDMGEDEGDEGDDVGDSGGEEIGVSSSESEGVVDRRRNRGREEIVVISSESESSESEGVVDRRRRRGGIGRERDRDEEETEDGDDDLAVLGSSAPSSWQTTPRRMAVRSRDGIGGISGVRRLEFQQEAERRRLAGRVQVERARGMGSIEELEEQLERWSSGCMWCRARGEENRGKTHESERCWRKKEDIGETKEWIRETEKNIIWEPYGYCGWCRVPQVICGRWEAKEDGFGYQIRRGGRCQYEGLFMSMIRVIMIEREERFYAWLDEEMNRDGVVAIAGEVEGDEADKEAKETAKWLGRKIKIGGYDCSQICRVLLEVGSD